MVFLFAICTQLSFAQFQSNGNGTTFTLDNVGVGLSGPSAKLDVNGSLRVRGSYIKGIGNKLAIANDGSSFASRSFLELWGEDGDGIRTGELALAGSYLSFRTAVTTNGYGSEKMRIDEEGNVGIGLTGPSAKLDINGDLRVRGSLIKGIGNKLVVANDGSPFASRSFIEMRGEDDDPDRTGELALAGSYLSFRTGVTTNGYGGEKMRINENGVVGIGTDYHDEEFKLAVEGKIICEELRVRLRENWPDYVFEEDYGLMPLEEVEKSIKENGHLPGIPSAQEIEENGGFEVGEMQRLMMEKIEELTLHLIDLKKENEQLKAEMQELKK